MSTCARCRSLPLLTHLGDAWLLTLLGAVVALGLWWRGQRTLALGWVLALGGNALLNPLLKRIFERVRPVHDHGLVAELGWSFPSGHTSGATVAYGMLAYVMLRTLPSAWHLPAVLGAAALAFTVGSSRVFLQVHFASDVVAGFASGTAWLMVCILSVGSSRPLAPHARALRRRGPLAQARRRGCLLDQHHAHAQRLACRPVEHLHRGLPRLEALGQRLAAAHHRMPAHRQRDRFQRQRGRGAALGLAGNDQLHDTGHGLPSLRSRCSTML